MVLKVSDFDKAAGDQYLRLGDKGRIEVCGKGFKGWLKVKWLRLKMFFSKNAERKYIDQNQKVMAYFIETIKKQYGKQWGFVAFRGLTRDIFDGKPLTGYKVQLVLQKIDPYQTQKAIKNCLEILKDPKLDKSLLLTHLSKLNECLLASYRNHLPAAQMLERDKREEVALNFINSQLAAYSDAEIEKLYQNLNNPLLARFHTAMGYSNMFLKSFDSYKERVVDELTQMGEPLEILQRAVREEAERRGIELSPSAPQTGYIKPADIPKSEREIITSFIEKRAEGIKKIYQSFIPKFLDSLKQTGRFETFKTSLKKFVEANQVYSGAEECWEEHLTTFLAQKSNQELQLLTNNLQKCKNSWLEYLKTPEAKIFDSSALNQLSEKQILQLIPSQYKQVFESTELAIQEEMRKRGIVN